MNSANPAQASRSAERNSRFFAIAAWCGLGIGITGFAKTFLLPLIRGEFQAPPVVFVHGALLFGWLGLLIGQVTLVRVGRTRTHRTLGWFGAVLALAIAWSTIAVGRYAMLRDIAKGDPLAVSSLLGAVTASLIFLGLVALAIGFRRRPAIHKRLMLVATIGILWPAWFRFRHYFPAVPHPEIIFAIVLADAMILIAMLRDRLALGRVHPVYLWAGLGLIAEHVTEAILFDSTGWRTLAGRLAELIR